MVDRATKVLNGVTAQHQAELNEKAYREQKKKEALKRIKEEIDDQNLKKKMMKEQKERLKKKRE